MNPDPSRRPTATLAAGVALALALALVALAACGGDGEGDGGDDAGMIEDAETDVEVTVTDPSTGKPSPPSRLPDRDPAGGRDADPENQPAVTVPPSAQAHVDAAVADLAARLGADAEGISVADFRAVTWSDASLGCPQPDMNYIQRLTPGTLLVLRAPNGTRHEYHGGPAGALSYCAAPRPPVEGQGAG